MMLKMLKWSARCITTDGRADFSVQDIIKSILDTANVTKPVVKGDRENLYNIASYFDQCRDLARRVSQYLSDASTLTKRTQEAQGMQTVLEITQDVIALFRGSHIVNTKHISTKTPIEQWMNAEPAKSIMKPSPKNRRARLTEALIFL